MTGLLALACGALIVLHTQLLRTRRMGRRQSGELRALGERVSLLEHRTTGPAASPPAKEDAAPPAAWPAPVTLADEPPSIAAPAPFPRPLAERLGPGPFERLAALLRSGWDQWVAQNVLAAAGGVFVLLGTAFFVAIAIRHGWLTPWRQVGAALAGGSLLLAAGWRSRPSDTSRRAAWALAQSLVGAGAGVLLLGIVAGARIYDAPLYPSAVGLVATGAVAGAVVLTALRWDAQLIAGLGIASAVAGPFLVDAPASVTTLAFTGVALAGGAVLIAGRGWPWLLQVAIVASLLQPARWSLQDGGEARGAALTLAIVVVWWALLALPALLFELRADTPRLRVPTSGALFELASLASLAGRLAFGSFHATGFELLLCLLAGSHLAAGAVMLRARPSSQAGAIFVWAVGAALAAGAAAVLLGGAAQPAFWAVEAVAMLWLYVAFADRQAGLAAAVLGLLTTGFALHLAPPDALVLPLEQPARGVLALAAVVAMAAVCAVLLRGRRALATAAAAAAWVALVYGVAVLAVAVVAPDRAGFGQAAQLAVSGAWVALATLLAAGALVLPSQLRRVARRIAAPTLALAALKALALDSLVLGAHETCVLWLLAGLALAAALLTAMERRLPAAPVPLPAPLLVVLVVSGLSQPGADAYRAGSAHLLATLGVLALAALAAALAVRRLPARRAADALVALVAIAMQMIALATVTLATPQLGSTSEPAQRAVSAGPLVLALLLLGAGLLARRGSAWPRMRMLQCAAGMVVLAAALVLADTAAFGATAGAIPVDGGWLVVAGAFALASRACPARPAVLAAAAAAASVCTFVLVTTGTPRALAFGAPHGLRLLGAALIATVAVSVVARRVPARRRIPALACALAVALYAMSVLLVTALAADAARVDQAAQLGLSVLWTIWGVGLLGVGVTRRGSVGLFLRRAGIGLTALAAAKVLIVDTSHFDTAHRAGVFLALGAVLLAGAYLYTRLARDLEAG